MKLIFILSLMSGVAMAEIHPDFVSLEEVCPNIIIEASYSSKNNFTGEVVKGYKAKKSYMAKAAALALCEVQKDALNQGYALKVFDGYRPVKAVQFFLEWAQRPETNPELKELYYPKFTRMELFETGYIAKQSSHSRGSAVDLTLVNLKDGRSVDMGSGFDYFDTLSNTEFPDISEVQKANRRLLKKFMEGRGFKNFSKEWWHYSFKPEPFPGQSFDFDVE